MRPVLLSTGSAARLLSTDQSPTGKVSCQRFVERSQFACYAKFLVTRHALPANILLRDAAKKMSSKEA